MQKKPLTELLSNIEQEMLRLHYNNAIMQFYRRRWRMLLQFAQERGEIFYSERLGMDFVEKHFHILEKDFNRTLSQSNAQNLRIIRMIGDFQLHHTVLRRYYKHKAILIEPSLIALNNRFKSYCSSKEYSKVTTDHYIKQSARFMDYLASQKVTDYRDLNLPLIHAYIKTLAGYTYKTVEQVICSLRAFLRFLLDIGEIQTDFATKIPMIRQESRPVFHLYGQKMSCKN